MKVYLAGPMTGVPEHNFPAFERDARRLRAIGHEVVSPRELSGDAPGAALETPWEHHLRRDLAEMLGCDAVALLPAWTHSRGAKLEVQTAWAVGIPVYYAEDLLNELTRGPAQALKPENVPEEHRRPVPPALPRHDVTILATPEEQGLTPGGERVVDPATGAVKADGGKSRVDLLPVRPMLDIGAVLEFGARKYAPWNWARGFDWSRPYAAALRHLYAWYGGEDLDQETGLSHLAHAACCLLFLLEYEHSGAGHDDRPGKD